MEINPNHPVTREIRDHWYKVCAILMQKMGENDVEITTMDVAALAATDVCIVADCRDGKFIVRLMERKDVESLARKEGGLPV